MSEPVSSPPLRTWRPMVLWTAGILVALGFAWFVAAVVVPVWRTGKVVESFAQAFDDNPTGFVDRLGGKQEAGRSLTLYLRMPERVAPCKEDALRLLNACLPEGRPAVATLVPLLGHRDPRVRRQAVVWLGRLGPEARAAVPALILALDDQTKVEDMLWVKAPFGSVDSVVKQDRPVRWHAILALEQIGPAARAAQPALAKLLANTDPEIRTATAEALKKIRGEESKP